MVGIVIVSHSRGIADGVVELAREMGGEEVALGSAGGTDEPGALGTDAMRVLEAITGTYSDDGVLVLMDLGSAVMSAEMALEMLDEDQRANVQLCEAPLVEGAVAAATAAKLGRSLEQVADEARGGLAGKQTHLGVAPVEAAAATSTRDPSTTEGPAVEVSIAVANPLGLHARPAARFVRTAGDHEARVEVTNLSTNRGPVDATSLNALTTLGVTQDHEILVRAWGPGASAAIAALQALAADNFGDPVAVEEPTEVAGHVDPGDGLAGLPASPGIALGPVRHLRRVAPEIPRHPTDDVEDELLRLEEATAAASKDISELRTQVAKKAGEYEAEIFDAHLLMLEDAALQERTRALIREERRNAADALWNNIERSASEFEALDNERLRERGRDVIDVGERVLGHLLGRPISFELAEPGIVVAEELTPSAAAALDPEIVRGIATATGGPTSHGAILARALGVPAVVGVGEGILELRETTDVVVDGDRGVVIVDPAPEEATRYAEAARSQAEAAATAASAAVKPAVTMGGAIIEVGANIGSLRDAERAVDAGADGVGLLRTEFLFLDRGEMPTESEQFESLAAIARTIGDRPLTIRTLDVGADKPLPYVHQSEEENPFLGVRGIRLSLTQSHLLEAQLRAIARLARRRPLRVMFPMVATVQEYQTARRLLDDALGGELPADLEVGIMVEVPSAALTAARFAPHVDFFSIGTNDLSQYTMAAERGNAAVASLADPLQPAVLRLISETVRAAAAHGRWVGVCGEAAGDTRAVALLLGLGVTELSMAAPSIARVKEAVRAVDIDEATRLAARALECDSASAVRRLLEGKSS